MRLDHIAYRVKNRYDTAQFFRQTLEYKIDTEFDIEFEDGSKADCIAMVPPEVRHPETRMWSYNVMMGVQYKEQAIKPQYHAPPEIFISDGPPGSIVGDWVAERNGIGGVHHIAYQVDDVENTMKEWKEKGYVEFLSDEPMTCPGLIQVFSKPSELTGVIYELISRKGDGFCKDNVKNLMLSTQGR